MSVSLHLNMKDSKGRLDMEEKMRNNQEVFIVKPDSTRIDASFAVQFKNQMLDIIHSGKNTIILDLSEVDFIDSSGLGALVSSRKTLGSNGDIILCDVSERVLNIFKVTRMNKVFKIFESKEEALRDM
jgi:anti-sigma B factor antagonist